MISENYLEKVYAGFLGMNVGIRLGAPVEPTIWTCERIRETYGDIRSYVKEYKNFAADDDVNGPVFFLRALNDDARDGKITPQDVARAWLNYSRHGIGMFWWGGYGISTEHTAYENLKAGISAPQSGSIKQNGRLMAEQIGGQIFIDTWGLVLPGQCGCAANYAEIAASVSHDGEGLYGARFIAAAISKAFVCDHISEIVLAALAEIPDDSTYHKVAMAVWDFYKQNPMDFRACREMLERDWGYDKYRGVCHIIPNAGVCVLALLYGGGDFNRTVEIATMCGWDTDCNAGNVGTILGVMCGIDGIAPHYRTPINDGIVLSSISGYLNILDIPTYVKEVALLGYSLCKLPAPEELKDSVREGEIYFDFELKGSTHNIRLSNTFLCRAEHSTAQAHCGSGSLKILYDCMNRGNDCRIYYKPYYLQSDFSDVRYSPVFSPKAYSGQTVSFWLYLDQWYGREPVSVAPYARFSYSQKELEQGDRWLTPGEWQEVSFKLPDSKGELIDEIGFVLKSNAPAKDKSLGCIYLDDFSIIGKAEYDICFAKQQVNFGCVSPLSQNYGAWSVEDGELHAASTGYAEAYTGNYFAKDYTFTVPMTPLAGEGHMLAVRSQGAMRGYHVGFSKVGTLALYRNDYGLKLLCEKPFPWEMGHRYWMQVTAERNLLTLLVNGVEYIRWEDNAFVRGMYGFARHSIGRTLYGNYHYQEL